ncbi:hypothetical protein Tsubulata_027355 [Turnera subulata]|uniref:DUF569 domain-containing protein n=1 Tax=Turnera subulata TaxID=218843 RepID=A0A9Q0J4T9_9ROSI|nr:hypothetical protein Tsubulata_027355 [Turnera subulata]
MLKYHSACLTLEAGLILRRWTLLCKFFNKAKAVRLKSRHDKYLIADEDEETVRQSHNGSSERARWTVEFIPGDSHHIRLKSCYGKYLTASDEPHLLGMVGKKVVQDMPISRQDRRIVWEPRTERYHVKLRTREGKFLRANDGMPPWRNSITHDIPHRTSTQDWVLWEVDVVDILEDDSLPDYASFSSFSSSLSSSADSKSSDASDHSAHSSTTTLSVLRAHRPQLLATLAAKEVKLKKRGSETKYLATVLAIGTECDIVRLRSYHNKYLLAEDDQETVCQDRQGTVANAKWKVEIVEGGEVLRLKSCYGKYLTASNMPFLLGRRGKKVVQNVPNRLDSSVEWEPIREGAQVKFKTRYGQYLRANGGLPPWRNSITHEIPQRSSTQDWILWSVDVIELRRDDDDEATPTPRSMTESPNYVRRGPPISPSSATPTSSQTSPSTSRPKHGASSNPCSPPKTEGGVNKFKLLKSSSQSSQRDHPSSMRESSSSRDISWDPSEKKVLTLEESLDRASSSRAPSPVIGNSPPHVLRKSATHSTSKERHHDESSSSSRPPISRSQSLDTPITLGSYLALTVPHFDDVNTTTEHSSKVSENCIPQSNLEKLNFPDLIRIMNNPPDLKTGEKALIVFGDKVYNVHPEIQREYQSSTSNLYSSHASFLTKALFQTHMLSCQSRNLYSKRKAAEDKTSKFESEIGRLMELNKKMELTLKEEQKLRAVSERKFKSFQDENSRLSCELETIQAIKRSQTTRIQELEAEIEGHVQTLNSYGGKILGYVERATLRHQQLVLDRYPEEDVSYLCPEIIHDFENNVSSGPTTGDLLGAHSRTLLGEHNEEEGTSNDEISLDEGDGRESTANSKESVRSYAAVRLRSHHDKYLLAENDQETVCQDRHGTVKSAKWMVEFVEGAPVLRLKSCYGKYLTASNLPFLLGMRGKKVLQTLPGRLDSSVEWEPIREGVQVKLKTRYGQYLRANGGVPPWRNSITHDIPHRAATRDWILWDVDIVEFRTDDDEPTPQAIAESPHYARRRATSPTSPAPTSSLSSPGPSRMERDDDSNYPCSPPKNEGRVIYYSVADNKEGVVDENEVNTLAFKGSTVEELKEKLQEVTGLGEIDVCSKNPLNGKLYPLKLHLPPNNTSMHVVVVPSS